MTDVKVSGRQDKIFCKGDAFMSTVRFTHSPNRPFYLPKNRTAELHYKCLQVPLWKQELQNLDGHITAVNYDSTGGCSGTHSDKTADTAIRRYVLENRINLITETAQEVGGNLAPAIVENVTTGKPFYALILRDDIPYSQGILYAKRKQFYYLLSQKLEKLEEHYS